MHFYLAIVKSFQLVSVMYSNAFHLFSHDDKEVYVYYTNEPEL